MRYFLINTHKWLYFPYYILIGYSLLWNEVLGYDLVYKIVSFYLCRIQLGQPATVKVAANLVRLLSYNNKVWPWCFFLVIQFNLHGWVSTNNNSNSDKHRVFKPLLYSDSKYSLLYLTLRPFLGSSICMVEFPPIMIVSIPSTVFLKFCFLPTWFDFKACSVKALITLSFIVHFGDSLSDSF